MRLIRNAVAADLQVSNTARHVWVSDKSLEHGNLCKNVLYAEHHNDVKVKNSSKPF